LKLGTTARAQWLEAYVEQLVTRDVESVDPGRDPVRLRRYFEAYTGAGEPEAGQSPMR
jgi:hypothetical protein